MSLTVYTALLLLVANTTAGDIIKCKVPSNNTISNGFYTLDVSPTTVISNSTYTVTLTGRGNTTVEIQYMMNQPKVHTWICMEPEPFNHDFDINNTLVTNWPMFTTGNSDDYFIFQAQITDGPVTYLLTKILPPPPYPETTTNTALAAHPVPMCLEVIMALGLLWITSRL